MSFLREDLTQLAAYKSPHPTHSDDEAIAPQPILDGLDTNESPIDLPDDLKSELADTYRQKILANRYPNGDHLALRQAVVDYAARASQIDPDIISNENVTIGNGSDELIRSVLIATCLGDRGSILVSEPTFSMYAILADTLGVPVRRIQRKTNFEVDVEAAQSAVGAAWEDGPPVRAVFMVHPNSPTGNALTQQELDWMRQLSTDILIVVDEAYFEFNGRTTLADALSRPNWLVLRTFSKAFRLAAHRVGYGIGSSEIISALEKLRLPYNLPSFSQAAALAALAHSDRLLSQISTLTSERDRLLQVLAEHPYLQIWPSDSNFIYARLSDRGLAALSATQQSDGLVKVFNQLRAKGTLIRQTGGGLRISIGTVAENERTLANLQQVLGSKP